MSGPRLVVDLDTFSKNLDAVRTNVAPAELMLVVKDDAYGHGLRQIVQAAVAQGVRWIGTFNVHDALATRVAAGNYTRIFAWLTVGDAQISQALGAQIDLGVGNADYLSSIAAVARAQGITARVHLKIDSGLHRNGVRPEEWPGFIAQAREYEKQGIIRVVGIWSHLAEASDAEDDAAREVFDWAVAGATEAGCAIEVRHLTASAASFARKDYAYELVRIGAYCYGIEPAGGPYAAELGIEPVASLVGSVTAVGDTFVRVQVGSFDGIPSTIAGRAVVGTPGGSRSILVINNSTMDIAPWPGASLGQAVTVFGAGHAGEVSATALAESIGTIGEEILVRVSPLVVREYL